MERVLQISVKEAWQEAFGKPPPSYASPDFMQGHLAWARQAGEQSGLKRSTKRQLKELTRQLREGRDLTPERRLMIKPGTKLLHEYRGKKHEVVATETGFR